MISMARARSLRVNRIAGSPLFQFFKRPASLPGTWLLTVSTSPVGVNVAAEARDAVDEQPGTAARFRA